MQFGEWLREDIQRGRFEPAMVDHDLAILVTKVRRHSTSLYGPSAVDLFESVPPSDFRRSLVDTIAKWSAAPDWHGDERNVILALARIWFSACTGEIASKDVAAAWAAERLPAEHRSLMARAANSYLSGEKDELALVPERVAAAVRFCKGEIERELTRSS
jgi:streptomycin 3"-adenylyltransferase